MCGISGFVDFNGPLEDSERTAVLASMCEALFHRGPDDRGTYVDRQAALGIQRLSIIDVQGGAQPLISADGSCVLICNGEIYNYKELRALAERFGYPFRSRSDVEVILPLYMHFDLEFIQYLNGMFAFALWDSRRQRLILGRDRAGIKPLYYSADKNGIVFASELRSLLRHPNVSSSIDLASLDQYLSFEYVPSPRSILRAAKKLPPANLLLLTEKTLEQREYWRASFEQAESRPPVSWQDYRESFLASFGEAVERELMSDVPLGVFLSGGIDSSAISLMAARKLGRVKTFTLKFEDKSFDESRFARLAADALGTEHCELDVSNALLAETAARIGELADEPLADSSFIPTYLLSRFAREQVTVALGGDGGDELFAGYPTYQAHRLVGLYEQVVPHFARSYIIPGLVRRMPVSLNNISLDFKLRRFLSGRGVSAGVRHHRWLGSFDEEQKKMLLHPDIAAAAGVGTYDIVRDHIRGSDAHLLYNKMLACDLKLYLEGDILQKVDRASMKNSLEVRVPFLNTPMLEYALALPFELKMRFLTTKFFLKRALRGLLPKEILERPKKGFNIPIGRLLKGELKSLLLDALSESRLKRQGLFSHRYVERMIDEHLKGKADHRKYLWTLLTFQLWLEQGPLREKLSPVVFNSEQMSRETFA